MNVEDVKVGDRVDYFMPATKYAEQRWMPSTVEKITKTRVIVRVDAWPKRTRATIAKYLRKSVDGEA